MSVPTAPSSRRSPLRAFLDWCDSDYCPPGVDYRAQPDRIDFKRALPVVVFHLGCVAVYWVGVSPFAVAATIVLYYFRIFGVTAFHHRYFSHKCFTTSRAFQFVAAVWAGTATQRGSLWWAALHRHHHRHSDEDVDAHSPASTASGGPTSSGSRARATNPPTTPSSPISPNSPSSSG